MAGRTSASIWRQTYFLLYRNILMKKRNKGQLFQELFIPFIFCINLMAFSFTPSKKYDPTPLGDISAEVSTFFSEQSLPLAFAPYNADNEQVMMDAANVLNITADPQIIGFATEQDLVDTFTNKSVDTPPFMKAIVFSDDFPAGNLSYKIRVPYGSVSSSGSRASTEQCRGYNPCQANLYLTSGFTAIQMALDHAIASMNSPGTPFPFPQVFTQIFPKGTFETSTDTVRLVGTLYFLIMFLPFVAILLSNLVIEKEKKIKEVMKIMGMNETPFWLAWAITYLTIIAVVSIGIVAFTFAITLFERGNPFLIYLYFFFYGSSIITFSFMLVPFFDKALVAGAAGTFFTTIMSVIYFPLGLIDGIPAAVQWVLCLFSPVAFGLGLDKAIAYETSYGGLNFDTMTVGDFPPLNCLIMLMVDAVLYFILAVYFANVIPGMYGQSKVPWFFLLPSYWRGGHKSPDKAHLLSDEASNGNVEGGDIETVTADVRGRDGIKIHGLKKKFRGKDKKDFFAVNGVSLDIYEGQIFCLLGHNGAGKTTLINLLTGLMDANEGSASIYGNNIRDPIQMDDIRMITGVCNQQNTIFEFLTPPEHLKIYAGLKGIPDEEIESEVQRVLKDIELDKQTQTLAKDLSGGQQRKLCVGMAIIGDPKVLFLDEPSSGMDPYSRRQMWSLLKKQREGRVTVLTTHFMDEADILADRKAIVSKGNVRCCGSSLFLKNRYGIGYHLGMVVEQDTDPSPIKALVQTFVPDAQVGRAHGMELSFTLPLKEVGSFAGLFEEFEKSSGETTVALSLGVQSYGVSMTTLEEVFLKLGEDELEEEEWKGKDKEGKKEKKEGNGTGHLSVVDVPSYSVPNSVPYSIQQDSPLSAENPSKETTPLNEKSTIIPKYLDGASSYENSGIAMEEGASNQPEHVTVDFDGSPLDSTILASKPVEPTSWGQIKAVMMIQILLVIRTPLVFIFRILFPCAYVVLGVVLYETISFGGTDRADPNTVVLEPSLYLAGTDGDVTSRMTALLYKDSLPSGQDISGLLSEFENLDIKYAEQSNFSEVMDVAPHSIGLDAVYLDTDNATYTALYNDTTYHSIPMAINIMNNALYRLWGALSSDEEIEVTNQPLPDRGLALGFTSGIFFVMFFAVAVINIPPGFAITIVRERQLKTITQLRVSGMEMWRYWVAHFLIDCPQFLLVALCGVIVVVAFQLPSLTQGGALFMFLLFLIFYTPVTLIVGYCSSFLFTNYETAQGVLGIFFMYLAFFMAAPVIVLGPLVSDSAAFPMHIVFSIIFPPYSIFGALYFLDKIYSEAFFLGRADQLTFGDYLRFDNYVMPSVLILIIPTIGYFFLLRFLEIKKTGGDARDTCPGGSTNRKINPHKVNDDTIEGEDSDVIAERDNVQLIFDENKDSAVAINSLRREYMKVTGGGCCNSNKEEKIKVAVRNVSLSVNHGEVLGLLGPNGAGKTTTLNTVIAECEPTKGQIRVAGHDISSALSEAFEAMGYCPQIDPMYPDITMREHMNAFAAIKGIHKTDVKHVVDHYMKALDITEHADKKSQNLSGGTKRKLCFAMSMLGDPRVVLLDEPSTGMDPKSKRFLWNTISANFKDKRGAILTTHSMEEADAVCSRVGIMVLGQLKCLGTTQHLKDKYGGGYMLEVKLTVDGSSLEDRVNGLHKYVRGVVPDCEVTECFGERISYKIPKKSVTSLASVFKAMEKGKETLGVEEYSFSQSTLEQVFLQFAKEQEVADIDDKDKDNIPEYDRSVSVRSLPRPQDNPLPGTAESELC